MSAIDTWDGITRMPWGKHKDQPISALPTDYIDWCLANCTKLRPYLRTALQQELARRSAGGSTTRPAPAPAPAPVLTDELLALIDGWYRCLCRQHHPDRGGSPDVMQALSAACDDLRRRVRALKPKE